MTTRELMVRELIDIRTNSTLWNDGYARLFFYEQVELVQELLRNILCIHTLQVQKLVIGDIDDVRVQESVENPYGHSVIFDVFAVDADGNKYDIELQHVLVDDLPRRIRYYRSMIDMRSSAKGANYSDLPNTYVIFVTGWDFLGEGKVVDIGMTHFFKKNGGINWKYNDGAVTVIVNGAYKGLDGYLGKFVHDLNCVNPDDMLLDSYKQRSIDLKVGKEVYNMTEEMLERSLRIAGVTREQYDKTVEELNEANATIKAQNVYLKEKDEQLRRQNEQLQILMSYAKDNGFVLPNTLFSGM